ncbi:MAG: TIGR03790 family protein [Planctomycetales bacterium]|nr:TIGR03790 family protein [Planctomycetales bacterium]
MNRYLAGFVILIGLFFGEIAAALEPNEILVIVNKDISASEELGQYYCQRRNVPEENILVLSLGKALVDAISRDDYDKNIAEPVRKRLAGQKPGQPIRCLLTTYGVPYKVGPRGPLKEQQERFKQLETTAGQYEKQLRDSQPADVNARINKELGRVKAEIDWISGRETEASVDNELSLVLFGAYELYRWQPNQWNRHTRYPEDLILTVMVCRLDGPSPQIARGLIDKAISAEKTGLHGFAYIDSRGIPDDKKAGSYGNFDQKLRNLAVLLRIRTTLQVKEERTDKLFEPKSCPQTAIYCGWYSLKKYVDSFDFVDGAIGAHIASFEAIDLRDPNSTEWCPSMLIHGVTATFGPVAEPYLTAFPNPEEFFLELINGKCLVEAFYRALPFCSWQMMLIGDPLYTPFARKGS